MPNTTDVTRINRNIVECKSSAAEEPSGDAQELIETLWNVNRLLERHGGQEMGINRNIVECKSR